MRWTITWCMVVLTGGSLTAAQELACGPAKTYTIESKASCSDSGVAIGGDPEESSTFSCLASKAVQNRCGPDGSLTRLRAFQLWLKELQKVQSACTAGGGTLTYEDSRFTEPMNESFCSQAVPEVKSNMFEDTLCNFHSGCPAVVVRCERPCAGSTTSLLD